MRITILAIVLALSVMLMWTPTIFAQDMMADGDGIIESGENPDEELAKASQNPVADLISLPFQNNTNFNFGPEEKTQNVLNIQPVWPFSLTENWNLRLQLQLLFPK